MGRVIILDAGHGLNELGSYSRPLIYYGGKELSIINDFKPSEHDNKPGYYREDFGTLNICLRTQKYLEDLGYTVFLTRQDERNAGLYLSSFSDNEWKKRHWKAWKWIKDFTLKKKADIFVSIHTNAGGGTGTSCFWAKTPEGKILSEFLTKEISNEFNLKTRRIDKHRYMILRDTCKGRAVLLECLFHDNISDIKLISDDAGLNRMAKSIATGIDNYSKTF